MRHVSMGLARRCGALTGGFVCHSVMAGTEDGRILVATPKATKFEFIVQLESTPTMLTTLGDRSSECRIFVACRNGRVLLVKVRGCIHRRGWLQAALFPPARQPLTWRVAITEQQVGGHASGAGRPPAGNGGARAQPVGAGVDHGVEAVPILFQGGHCSLVGMRGAPSYDAAALAQGTRLFAAATQHPLQHLCPLAREGDREQVYSLAAAEDGAVALLRDAKEVHRVETGEPLRAMVCGSYGREPCALVRPARSQHGCRTQGQSADRRHGGAVSLHAGHGGHKRRPRGPHPAPAGSGGQAGHCGDGAGGAAGAPARAFEDEGLH